MNYTKMFPYLAGAALVAAVLIAVGAPLASLLPFALVLACPVMMIFMMRGMSGSASHDDHGGNGHCDDQDATSKGATPKVDGSPQLFHLVLPSPTDPVGVLPPARADRRGAQ